MKLGKIYAAIGMALLSLAAAPAAHAAIVFDNQNGFSVGFNPSGPPVATTFTLASADYITSIDIYHYGDSILTDTISLFDSSNNLVGTWATTIDNPLPYLHFGATLDISLGAGTYTIVDARPDAWAFNSSSGNQGFATVNDGVPPESAPEPASLALIGAGLASLGILRRRKRA